MANEGLSLGEPEAQRVRLHSRAWFLFLCCYCKDFLTSYLPTYLTTVLSPQHAIQDRVNKTHRPCCYRAGDVVFSVTKSNRPLYFCFLTVAKFIF